MLSYNDIDVICITETHLNNDILDSEIEIDGYDFYRKDRDFDIENDERDNEVSDGGGSIIYFKKSICVTLVDKFYKTAPDSLAITLNSSIGKVCIACIYRSPNLTKIKNVELLSCIENICDEQNLYETLLVGDFNLPDISWENCGLKCITPHLTSNKILLNQLDYFNTFSEKGLNWYLTNEITRRRMVKGILQESLLDQVLYTNEALVSHVNFLSPLGKSDHVSLKIELGISLCKPLPKCKKEIIIKPSWSKVTAEEILEFSKSNITWSYPDNLSVEEKWNVLHGKLMEITAIFPTCRFDSSNRPLKLPWDNSKLKRMRKKKDEAWGLFDASPSVENFSFAMHSEDTYNKEEFRLKSNYEKKLTSNLKDNSKGFYSYLRNKRKLKSGITSLSKSDGSRTSSAEESANVLAEAFESVFVLESDELPEVDIPGLSSDNILTDVTISHENVKAALESLNPFKSIGPDNIHPKILKSLVMISLLMPL